MVVYLHDLAEQESINTPGLLSGRDGRLASYWIIQNSSLQAHLCIECLLCVGTGICSDLVTHSVILAQSGRCQIQMISTGVFPSPRPLCWNKVCVSGESLPGLCDCALAAECRGYTKALGVWHVTVLMVRTLCFRLTAEISAANLLYSLVEIPWPQGAALIPTTCSASALVQSFSHLCLPDVRLSSASSLLPQLMTLHGSDFPTMAVCEQNPLLIRIAASIQIKSNSVFILCPDKDTNKGFKKSRHVQYFPTSQTAPVHRTLAKLQGWSTLGAFYTTSLRVVCFSVVCLCLLPTVQSLPKESVCVHSRPPHWPFPEGPRKCPHHRFLRQCP